MPNPNSFIVNPDMSLGTFIGYIVSKTGKGKSTWIMWLILKTYEKEIKAYFKDILKAPEPDKLYDDLFAKYSLTTYEQKRNKNIEKEEQIKKKEESLRLEKEKLELAKIKEKRLREEFDIQKDNQSGEEKTDIDRILEKHKKELE